MGRTQLQDAVPMTLGQEFHSFAATLEADLTFLERNVDQMYEMNLGGTAIGTSICADEAFSEEAGAAWSELTALRTRAELRGDFYHVTGEKLFITNVIAGRTIGLGCLIEEKPSVLIVDLPAEENDSFRLKKYGLYEEKECPNANYIMDNGFYLPSGLGIKNYEIDFRCSLVPLYFRIIGTTMQILLCL